jgi:hypothetical protein
MSELISDFGLLISDLSHWNMEYRHPQSKIRNLKTPQPPKGGFEKRTEL